MKYAKREWLIDGLVPKNEITQMVLCGKADYTPFFMVVDELIKKGFRIAYFGFHGTDDDFAKEVEGTYPGLFYVFHVAVPFQDMLYLANQGGFDVLVVNPSDFITPGNRNRGVNKIEAAVDRDFYMKEDLLHDTNLSAIFVTENPVLVCEHNLLVHGCDTIEVDSEYCPQSVKVFTGLQSNKSPQ